MGILKYLNNYFKAKRKKRKKRTQANRKQRSNQAYYQIKYVQSKHLNEEEEIFTLNTKSKPKCVLPKNLNLNKDINVFKLNKWEKFYPLILVKRKLELLYYYQSRFQSQEYYHIKEHLVIKFSSLSRRQYKSYYQENKTLICQISSKL